MLEIKTRAAKFDGPLQDLKTFSRYAIQCQLQMECTNTHSCILLSYHPESKSGNFFLVRKDYVLIEIVMTICNCILDDTVIVEWPHIEAKELQLPGQKILYKKLNFDELKPFRQFINKACKIYLGLLLLMR